MKINHRSGKIKRETMKKKEIFSFIHSEITKDCFDICWMNLPKNLEISPFKLHVTEAPFMLDLCFLLYCLLGYGNILKEGFCSLVYAEIIFEQWTLLEKNNKLDFFHIRKHGWLKLVWLLSLKGIHIYGPAEFLNKWN